MSSTTTTAPTDVKHSCNYAYAIVVAYLPTNRKDGENRRVKIDRRRNSYENVVTASDSTAFEESLELCDAAQELAVRYLLVVNHLATR